MSISRSFASLLFVALLFVYRLFGFFFLSNVREYYVSLNMTLAVRLPPLFFNIFIRIPYSS